MDSQPNQELVGYIKQRQERGDNLIEIADELKGAGWDQKDIDKAIGSFGVVPIIEKVPESAPKFVEPKPQEKTDVMKPTKKTIPTHLGSLILLLVVVIAGSGVWWMGSKDTEDFEVSVLVTEQPTATTTQAVVTTTLPSNYEVKADGVYYKGELVEGADPRTFQYVGGEYGKDDKQVYFESYPLVGPDPLTFQYVGGKFAKDKEHVIFAAYALAGADPATIQYVGGFYAKDKKTVYYFVYPTIADPATFEFVGGDYAKDKTYVFLKQDSVEGVDPNNCTANNLAGCEVVTKVQMPKIIVSEKNDNTAIKFVNQEINLNTSIVEAGCHLKDGIVKCLEETDGLSPFSVYQVSIPDVAGYLTFEYRAINNGDGDYIGILIDNNPVTVLSGDVMGDGGWEKSAPLPISGFKGLRRLTVALYGEGKAGSEFEFRNFQTMSKE